MDVKPCPICGEQPDVSTEGTFIDIECCVSMSRQKSDYLTIEERHYWQDAPYYRYTPEIEEKLFKEIVGEWNTRYLSGIENKLMWTEEDLNDVVVEYRQIENDIRNILDEMKTSVRNKTEDTMTSMREDMANSRLKKWVEPYIERIEKVI